MTYIKFILLQLLMFVAYILNWIFNPLAYIFRKSVYKHKTLWKWLILYWFSDDSEQWHPDPEINFINCWYGVYEIYNRDYAKFKTLNWFQKWVLAMKWGVIRNPNWNLQMQFKPKQGKKTKEVIKKNIPNTGDEMVWKDYYNFGLQHTTWETKGSKYFRYSFTRPLKRFAPVRLASRWLGWIGNLTGLFIMNEYTHINIMAGASDDVEHAGSGGRYLFYYRNFIPMRLKERNINITNYKNY